MKLTLGQHGFGVLDDSEVEQIVAASCKLLEVGGALIENNEMLKFFEQAGARVDYETQKVFLSKRIIERYLSKVSKTEWQSQSVYFGGYAEIYQGYYLHPEDGQMKAWNYRRLMDYIKLASSLKDLDGTVMLGCPLPETPVNLQPLYEKLFCWKYGIAGGDAIWDTALCPDILKMYEIYARDAGKDVTDIFRGTIYLLSPLKLGKHEAGQFMFFFKQGLRVRIGFSGALGGGLPVTIAGGLVVQLAENLFTSYLNHIFFGTCDLKLGAAISVMDMSTGSLRYGRPEKSIANIAMAQIARKLRVQCTCHSGLTDAKLPGFEAGVQKATSALLNAAATGYGYVAAGLLSTDEVFSPLQLIMDSELIGSFRRIGEGLNADEESLALDTLLKEGQGATFLGTEHTAMNFRKSIWMPETWSKGMFSAWKRDGKKTDLDFAKEKYFSTIKDPKHNTVFISEETEKKLIEVISKKGYTDFSI